MGLPDPDPSEVPSAPVGRKPTISTLQITNVALNTSDETLEEIFADYGPIKRCFVVNPKHPGAKKTLGIVQFAFSDDAQKALKVCKLKLASALFY
jgi:RNA recognition motif-containing protein